MSKQTRIVFYATDEAKKTIEEAAKLSNKSLSNYVSDIVLNNTDRDKLMDVLNNPPEPNEELKNLFC